MLQVTWEPYKGVRQTWDLKAEAFYRGYLVAGDVVEPYMPDRCMRQFGHVQGIPRDPIAQRAERSKAQTSRQTRPLWYTLGEEWNSRDLHMLHLHQRGPRARLPWDCTDDYPLWFAEQSHRIVQNPRQRAGPPAARDDVVHPEQRIWSARAFARPLLDAELSPLRAAARTIYDILGGDDDDDAV